MNSGIIIIFIIIQTVIILKTASQRSAARDSLVLDLPRLLLTQLRRLLKPSLQSSLCGSCKILLSVRNNLQLGKS